MGGQTPIKAILKQDIDYQDLFGNTKIIRRGEVVDLYIIKNAYMITDMLGRTTTQREPTFLAMKDTDTFDIVAEEFKTID